MASNESSENVLVGEVGRPHGLRGEVRIDVHSDVPERFEPGRELLLVRGDQAVERVRVRSFRPQKAGGVLGLEGYDDRDQAATLRGARLEVRAEDVPEAPEGLYYYWQLTGCQCADLAAGDLGRVVDVVEDGGGVLLEVRRGEQNLLIPFVDAFLHDVDVEQKTITLELPPGLVETCASKS